MKSLRLSTALVFALTYLALSGCSDPVLDASSPASKEATQKMLEESLAPEERAEFNRSMATIYALQAAKDKEAGRSEEYSYEHTSAKLSGKSVEQINEMAAELESQKQ